VRKGIIWHTQGSGKTALAYYNTRFLTDYYQRQGIIPKFYFIVDRIDLLIQAQREFASRGLTVHTIDSRDAFARDIKATQALHNHSGKPEITVVNIQKFEDDPDVVRTEDYDVSIQRVYFLDEVHRSYNPKGSFLANLSQSDQNAIKIGLTGTPLLGDDYNSRALFGDYIHKYYYNASIADGYSLDQKIDCNNRINTELEAMAKALYDYWFVQFDFPDVNGKPYQSSGGKMVYNSTLKREIPAGWDVLNLNDLVDLIKGNVSPSDVAENTPYIGLEHIGRKTIVLSDWATSAFAASDKTVFKKNDILFGKIRPYFHKVTVAPFDGITSTDTIILRPKKRFFYGLALETVFADEFVEAATQSSTGSKMPRADWNVLKHYKIPVPDTALLHSFNAVFEKALEKIYLSETENKQLVELRDWLLPMLMNGQVTVA